MTALLLLKISTESCYLIADSVTCSEKRSIEVPKHNDLADVIEPPKSGEI